jgi:hypothetical protein
MASFVFNIAKGRVGEYVTRTINNDPANAAIIWVPLSQSGTEAQGQDLTTLAAVEADANFAERTTGGWARITHDDAGDGLAWTVDNTNNRSNADSNDLVWAGPAAANNTTGLLACYDSDTTAGTDSNIIPILHLDMAVTTDGNQVTYQFNAEGWFRAA